jgi:hypothetical protein
MLKDALEAIPENTPQKEARAAAMAKGESSVAYQQRVRWIGRMNSRRRDS